MMPFSYTPFTFCTNNIAIIRDRIGLRFILKTRELCLRNSIRY